VKQPLIGRNNTLFICAFVYCLANTIISFSLIYLFADRFGFSAGQVGASLTLGTGAYFLCCNLYQRFGGRAKPKYIIFSAVACCFLSAVFLSVASSGAAAITAWCLIQGCTGFFWPPVMAWFTQGLTEAELNRDISWYNRAWMGGSLVGPLAGGGLYRHGLAGIFITVFLCLFLTLFILAFLIFFTESVRNDNTIGRREEDKQARGVERSNRLEKTIRSFKIRGWISGLCGNVFIGVLGNVVPLFIRDALGYTEKTAGLVLLFRGVAGLIAFTFYARFTFWHFNRRWFFALQGLLIAASLMFLAAQRGIVLYSIIAFCVGFFYAGCYNNSIFHAGADKKNPAKNMALHEIFLSIGGAAGTLGGGFCYQYLGMGSTFLILALIQAAGLGVQIWLDRQA
jgi:predicted MFS family arabinose efflux permease